MSIFSGLRKDIPELQLALNRPKRDDAGRSGTSRAGPFARCLPRGLHFARPFALLPMMTNNLPKPADPSAAVELIDVVPIGAYVVDEDFRIRAVNPIARPVFGEISGSVIGRDFAEIIHVLWNKEFAEDVVRIFRRTLTTGESYVSPRRDQGRADRGSVESYEWRVDRIVLSDGRLGAVCFFRDVTDRKRTEELDQRLALIVESSDDAIISKDLNGVIQSWNKGAERLFGYTADEVIGKPVNILIPDDRQDEEPEILERIRRGERIDHYETIRRAKDGTLLDISLTVSPIRDADGKVIGASKVSRNVGDRMRAEQMAQRLAAIVESSDDAIISKDLDGIIRSWNQGAERLFGYRADEIIGKSVMTLIPPDRQDEEPGILARIRRGDRIDHYETVRRRKDGSLVDISLTVSPMRDARGRVVGASKIARDISLKKQAETTRQLLLNELNHRVKNTLASVQAIVQQTLWSTKDPADFAARFSGRIQSMARVHSLLTESTWTGADLRELIRDQLLQGPVDETKLTAWGPAVQLGAQTTLHLALMLHELGTNSIKHGALATAGGWVTVSWTVRDDTLHLQWEERGGPVVAAPVKRGFGMTLIEQSAKSEGGRAQMLVDAKGVTWQIELPLPPSRARVSPATPETQMVSATVGSADESGGKGRAALAGRRLLVIEDEPLIALAIIATLESAGAQVARPAGTEKEALKQIAEGTFDGALLDANLHGRPVGEIAAALTRRRIPFVFVTGYGRQALPDSFRHASLVAKPFSDRELIEAAAALGTRSTELVRLKG